MVKWLKRRRPVASRTTIVSPGAISDVERVEIAKLTPRIDDYLAHAAVLQLAFFELLGRAVATAPDIAAKESVSRAASVVLARHHALVAELEQRGVDASASMAPFAEAANAFTRTVQGNDWLELLTTCYVTTGILDDCLFHLAGGLPLELADRMRELLQGDEPGDLVKAELARAIEAEATVASRLALWGRRLVGDTLLVARSTLDIPPTTSSDDARLEPVFTELIASHTRRMDDLGLTA